MSNFILQSTRKNYSLIDGEWTIRKVDETTYAVAIQTAPYVEEYNRDVPYTDHVLDGTENTLTFKVEYRNGAWELQGSTPVINVKHEPERRPYTLSYDWNDRKLEHLWYTETWPSTEAISVNSPVKGANLTRDGYILLGWADSKNATTPDYLVGRTITLTWQNPTKTIYAVWEKQPQPDITDPTDFAKTQYVPLQCKDNANHRIEKLLEGLPDDAWAVEWTPGSKEATLKLYPAKIAPLYKVGGEHKAVDESTVTVTLAYTNRWSIAGRIPAIPAIKITCAAPVIPDPTEFIGIKTVPVQCDNKAVHYVEYAIDGLIDNDCAELVWSTGSKAATLKLYPEKIAKRFSAIKGAHTAVTTDVVTVELTYNGGWKIDGTIPVIHVTCAAQEIPDPNPSVRKLNIYVKCVTSGVNHSTMDVDLGSLESSSGWTVAWTKPNTTATLTLYPDKIAEHYSKTLPGHTAVSTTAITIGLTYANGKWAADRVLPDIEVKCEPAIPNPTDYVKEQFVTVVCDDKTAHPNIHYLLENLPAGSVDVQWDGAAKTAKLVLKPDKIAEHYGMAYGAHTAVNPADVEVSLTYANDAWSLSAAIPDVHVTCKPAQEIPNPKDSFDKLLVNVACNTENSGHDPIEVPLSAVANSVNVRWEPGTATAYITLTPSIFATYYSQHNNGANGAHDPVAPAAVTVEAHYDNEKGWFWTKPTINVKCEPVYTITYNWRGVVKPADVKNVNNPGTFTADELPITLKAPDFKNNEWPQKFLNWRDAAGNVVTQITEPGNVELYAYYQFPVKYTVYDENDQKVDELSVTEWYNEDDFADYSLRSGEKTGHDFDGWYQTTKDFGNTNKRVTKLNMAKKYELVGKLTRKEYTVTASLFLNGSEEATKDARGVVISRSVKGLYGDPINYDGENGLNAQLKEAALAADAANEPNPDYVDINICLNDKSGNPFAAETYGQEGYNWRDMQWPENNPTKKWIVAYAWAYVDTYYDVTFNVNMEGVAPVDTQTVKCNATANEPTAPTKEGYKFLGWFKDGENTAFDFDTPITQKTELTAKWERNTYTIIYHGNGGVKVKGDKTYEQVTSAKLPIGEPTTLKSAEFTRDNYRFLGWSYFENGSVYFNAAEKNVLFEESDIDENGNVHLYAIWKRLSYPVTLRYNANTTDEVTNMPEPLEQTKNSDETGNAEFNISGMIPGRAGYRFLGWAVNKPDAAEDDIDFKAGESSIFVVNYQDDITLYAVWQELYTVTYSYDPSLPAEVQATIPKDPDTYTVGQKVTTAAKPNSVRVGENIWTFKTWKLDGVEVAPNTQVEMVSGGLHFEGIWETKLIHYSLTIQYVDKKGKELAESHMDLLSKGEAYKVDSPKIKGYKLKDKDDAVIKGTMPGRNLTIEVVYIKKSTGGGSGTIDSPNKPTTKAPALTLNTDDHFAFINGYPDGSVQPEGNVTRAETAAILYRIMGDECQSYYKTNSSSYSDVARGDWYNTYVATLENAGVIVDTRTNGKFRPNDAITRAELASMIAQFAGLESASAAKFNDVGSRYWAAEEIAIAAKMGWINGYPDGSFRPDRNVTRAELMAMVNRALGRTPKSAGDLLSGMKTWRDNANVNAWYYLDVQEATNDHTYTKSGTHETWKKLL